MTYPNLGLTPSVILLYGSSKTGILQSMDIMLQSSIDQAVKSLVQALKPRQVYLFGSCATGRVTDGSDIDLLVVVPDDAGDKLTNTSKAYKATSGLPYPKDIIVDCESVFQKRSKWISSIEREVLETGKLVYGRS